MDPRLGFQSICNLENIIVTDYWMQNYLFYFFNKHYVERSPVNSDGGGFSSIKSSPVDKFRTNMTSEFNWPCWGQSGQCKLYSFNLKAAGFSDINPSPVKIFLLVRTVDRFKAARVYTNPPWSPRTFQHIEKEFFSNSSSLKIFTLSLINQPIKNPTLVKRNGLFIHI